LIARLRRNCLLLWLALAAMLGHGLLPQGFMLGRDAAAPDRYGLIFCSGGEAHAVRGSADGHALPDGGASIELGKSCAFAMAVMAALPPPLAVALDVPARPLPPPSRAPFVLPATPYPRPHATGPPALA
jgi:hypothetical protein